MTNTTTAPTQCFALDRAELTPEVIERAREIARAKGRAQFGFRAASSKPGAKMHTIIAVNGGTLSNPSGARGDGCYDPIDDR